MKTAKNKLEEALKQQDKTLHLVTKPRVVKLMYRGIEYEATVSSYLEEFQLKVAAFAKGVGVKSGMLQPLFCEQDLCDPALPEFKGTFDEKFFKACANARTESLKFVEDSSKASATEIKACLSKHHKLLASLDRDWKVELNFWLSQCGEGGERRFKQTIIGSLATAEKKVDLSKSVQAIQNIMDGKLFQFVSVGMQANTNSIHDWLKTIRDGRAPKIPDTTGNEFFMKIIEHMGYFCRVDDTDNKELVGRAAIDKLLAVAREKKEAQSLALPDLRCFSQYNWLLTETEMAEVKEMTTAVLSAGAGGASSASGRGNSSSSSGGPKPPPTRKLTAAQAKKRKTDEDLMRAATKALFKND